MHRPQSVADRVSADGAYLTASERAARAAALARRAAAARRRARLVVGLLLVTLLAWVAVPTAQLSALLAVAPTLLLAAVLVAGRRAVLAGQRADAAWVAGAARRAARPGGGSRTVAVGRAVHPSEAVTEILEKVQAGPVRSAAERVLATGEVPVVARREEAPDAVTEPVPVPAARAAEDAAWVPVPVPPPTYVLKPEARRPEPRPLTGPQPAVPPAASGDGAGASDARPTTGGLALDAILARRRAAGE